MKVSQRLLVIEPPQVLLCDLAADAREAAGCKGAAIVIIFGT